MSENIAKQRILDLVDGDTFIEEYNINDEKVHSGLVTGHGYINGKKCFFYSQDPACTEGMINQSYIDQFKNIYKKAMDEKAPILGIIDSELSIDNKWYRDFIDTTKKVCGLIPQYSIIYGKCIGGMARIASFSDFRIMRANAGEYHMINMDSEADEIRYNAMECLDNGVVDLIGNKSMLNPSTRALVSIFVANKDEQTTICNFEKQINGLSNMFEDISGLFMNLADEYKFVELKRTFAPELVTGFVSIRGQVYGVIGNARKRMTSTGIVNFDEVLTSNANKKANEYLDICGLYNIPVLHLLNHEEFMDNVHKIEEICEIGKLVKKAEALKGAKIQHCNDIVTISISEI